MEFIIDTVNLEEIKEEEDTDFQQANKAPVLQHAQVENIKTTEDVL